MVNATKPTTEGKSVKNGFVIPLIGFAAGFGGFLLLFKVILLERIPPSDELAPGIVVAIATMAGASVAALLMRRRHRGNGTHERH